MASEQPPVDADLEASKAEASDDPLYVELVRLRVLGLRQDITKRLLLPELIQIADAVCPNADLDDGRIKCAMKKAAERFDGKYGMALEILWGVDTTYGWGYVDRRKKAMLLLGGKQTKGAYDKSHRERTARDFALQLRTVYQEVQGAEGVSSSPFQSDGRGGLAIERPDSLLRKKLSARRVLACFVTALLLVAGFYLIKSFVLGGGSRSMTVPPPGSVIDATTGQVVKHVSSRTTPQFVQVSGGNIFHACDRTIHPNCGTIGKEGVPLRVHLGDIVEFSISLFNPNNIPVPYLHMYAYTYGSGAGPGDWIAMSIKWPIQVQFGHHMRSPPPINPVEVIYPHTAPFPALTYIPWSTVLLRTHHRLLAHLPDGIMEGGIALTNVGPPVSCSYCEQEYQRFVNFKMRVTNYGRP